MVSLYYTQLKLVSLMYQCYTARVGFSCTSVTQLELVSLMYQCYTAGVGLSHVPVLHSCS